MDIRQDYTEELKVPTSMETSIILKWRMFLTTRAGCPTQLANLGTGLGKRHDWEPDSHSIQLQRSWGQIGGEEKVYFYCSTAVKSSPQ